MKTTHACDMSRDAVDAFKHNFPEANVVQADARDYAASLAPGIADVVAASVPTLIFKKPKAARGNLYELDMHPAFVTAVERVQPKAFILETAKNLGKVDEGVYCKRIMTRLMESGYHVNSCHMESAYFGVPQFRERLVFIGIRRDLEAIPLLPRATHRQPDSDPHQLAMFEDLTPRWVPRREVQPSFKGRGVELPMAKIPKTLPIESILLAQTVSSTFSFPESIPAIVQRNLLIQGTPSRVAQVIGDTLLRIVELKTVVNLCCGAGLMAEGLAQASANREEIIAAA